VEGCKILSNIKGRLIYGEVNQYGTSVYATSGEVLFGNHMKD